MSDQMSEPKAPPRTEVALLAAKIAGTFRGAFEQDLLGAKTPDMTSPEETTEGGLRALQHVTLKMSNGLAMVIGTVRCLERRAELLPYQRLAQMHVVRFKEPIDFDAVSYEVFVGKARSVLGDVGITVSVADDDKQPEPVYADGPQQQSRTKFWALAVGVVIGCVLAWLVLR